MIVDSHVHLRHGGKERTEYDADEIVRVMDAVGVDRSVVFAMSTSTRRSIEMARRAREAFPDRLIPYAYALPAADRAIVDELEEAIAEGVVRGIKIHGGECRLVEHVIDPVLRLAAERKVPCLIDFAGRHADLERMVEAFPEADIIVAHFGSYLCTNAGLIDRFIEIAERSPRVYLDTSGVLLPWKIRAAVDRLGAGRVIFGTDGPHPAPDLAGFAREALERVRMAGLTEDEERAVLGGNIAKLLGLAGS